MSDLGHKRTYAVQNGMSALPLIATVKADIASQDECSSSSNRGVRTMHDDANLAIPTRKESHGIKAS